MLFYVLCGGGLNSATTKEFILCSYTLRKMNWTIQDELDIIGTREAAEKFLMEVSHKTERWMRNDSVTDFHKSAHLTMFLVR